jgi:hypothetical protein
MPLDNARTQTFYGRQDPSKGERNTAESVIIKFREMVTRLRLDPKSFFQDFDKHNHFKVSPKIFQQVLAYFGFSMSAQEMDSVVKNYCNSEN